MVSIGVLLNSIGMRYLPPLTRHDRSQNSPRHLASTKVRHPGVSKQRNPKVTLSTWKTGKGKPARLTIGEPLLPEDVEVLPSPKALYRCIGKEGCTEMSFITTERYCLSLVFFCVLSLRWRTTLQRFNGHPPQSGLKCGKGSSAIEALRCLAD